MGLSVRRAIAVILVVLCLGIASCGGDREVPTLLLEGDASPSATNPLMGTMSEVSPPERIQQLKPFLDVYQPQVRIVSPQENETLRTTSVSVKLQVRDFPIYKDEALGLGPHLHLFLDDQPYTAVYNTDDPIVFDNLAPGTHTLRAFASRPWHESFKNEGAYAQTTFNVFTESPRNNPNDSKALLTYSRPQGTYGAEPIMLDFYLTNAPLHIVAEDNESISDWRIRCTINGESFVFDRWQPIYLKGFQPGTNWIKLEVIDENGNLIQNAFNTGLRLIEYAPGGDDGLAKLVRGDIPLSQAKVLVDPNYEPPAPPAEVPESNEELDTDEVELPEAESPVPLTKTEEEPTSTDTQAPTETDLPETDLTETEPDTDSNQSVSDGAESASKGEGQDTVAPPTDQAEPPAESPAPSDSQPSSDKPPSTPSANSPVEKDDSLDSLDIPKSPSTIPPEETVDLPEADTSGAEPETLPKSQDKADDADSTAIPKTTAPEDVTENASTDLPEAAETEPPVPSSEEPAIAPSDDLPTIPELRAGESIESLEPDKTSDQTPDAPAEDSLDDETPVPPIIPDGDNLQPNNSFQKSFEEI